MTSWSRIVCLVVVLAPVCCTTNNTYIIESLDASHRGTDGGDGALPTHDGGTDGHTPVESGPGAEGGKDVRTDSPTCDPMGDPSTNPCAITETEAVFVALGDGGAGAGTRTSPYTSIQAGITNAGAKRVYVCGGTYAESVKVTSSVSVYGGFTCANSNWMYTGAATTVQPTSPGYALDVEGATGAQFENLTFASADAVDAGAASIAIFVNASTAVSFTHVTAKAGAGFVGASGGEATSNWCSDAGMGGLPANGGLNGGTCSCKAFGSSKGGAGGGVEGTGFNGSSVPDASPSETLGNDGIGGTGTMTGSCKGPGDNGANGAARDGGSQGPLGMLTAAGWMVATAGSGLTGDPGMGGGGGGGTSTIGGAGGGAGGCGGSGGQGGAGGGASVAIAVISSQVSYSDVTLVASNGGNGGSGGPGQPGQAGGPPGIEVGCNGGAGGGGAGGGGGGGGAGGPSVGIGWAGDASLRVDDASIASSATLPGPSKFSGSGGGTGGVGGDGGAPASTTGAVPGIAGRKGPNGILGAVAPL